MINIMRPEGKMRNGLISLCRTVALRHQGKPLNIIELGSYCGESSAIFLENLLVGGLYCVDAWSETNKYKPAEIGEAEKVFDAFWKKNGCVLKIKSTTETFLKRCIEEELQKRFYVHLIYIDADHRYEGVKRDIELSMKLLDPGSILAGHDYNDKKFPGVVRAVNESFGKPDGVFEDTSWIKFL